MSLRPTGSQSVSKSYFWNTTGVPLQLPNPFWDRFEEIWGASRDLLAIGGAAVVVLLHNTEDSDITDITDPCHIDDGRRKF